MSYLVNNTHTQQTNKQKQKIGVRQLSYLPRIFFRSFTPKLYRPCPPRIKYCVEKLFFVATIDEGEGVGGVCGEDNKEGL